MLASYIPKRKLEVKNFFLRLRGNVVRKHFVGAVGAPTADGRSKSSRQTQTFEVPYRARKMFAHPLYYYLENLAFFAQDSPVEWTKWTQWTKWTGSPKPQSLSRQSRKAATGYRLQATGKTRKARPFRPVAAYAAYEWPVYL